jgi:hypothetical protein
MFARGMMLRQTRKAARQRPTAEAGGDDNSHDGRRFSTLTAWCPAPRIQGNSSSTLSPMTRRCSRVRSHRDGDADLPQTIHAFEQACDEIVSP